MDEHGNEIWYARELTKIVEYSDYRDLPLALIKAMDACKIVGKKFLIISVKSPT